MKTFYRDKETKEIFTPLQIKHFLTKPIMIKLVADILYFDEIGAFKNKTQLISEIKSSLRIYGIENRFGTEYEGSYEECEKYNLIYKTAKELIEKYFPMFDYIPEKAKK